MDVPEQELAFCKQNCDTLKSEVFFLFGFPQRSHRDATEPHAHQAISTRWRHRIANGRALGDQRIVVPVD